MWLHLNQLQHDTADVTSKSPYGPISCSLRWGKNSMYRAHKGLAVVLQIDQHPFGRGRQPRAPTPNVVKQPQVADRLYPTWPGPGVRKSASACARRRGCQGVGELCKHGLCEAQVGNKKNSFIVSVEEFLCVPRKLFDLGQTCERGFVL